MNVNNLLKVITRKESGTPVFLCNYNYNNSIM